MGEIVVNRNGSVHLYLIERNSRTIKSAVLSQELLADDSVNVKVESKNALDLKINDYIFIDGLTYRINQLPSVTKNSENNFEYDLTFQGLMFDLKRCKFFNADANDFKTELEFPLIGDLEFFLTVVRNNMRRFSIDWEVGSFPANTETKSLSFSSDNCLSALQKICQEYKVEFWIKQENGKFKIHTGAFGNTIPTILEYGRGNGLYSLSRKNVNENDIVSRLYVNGGSTNIPNEYRGFSKNLLMQNSAYLEDTALINEIGLIEGSITFEDIYPKRTGVISALGSTKFKFVDSSMDFDLNEKEADGVTTKYLIAGTSAKIHFNTGNLAGYQFEIKKGGYDHATKTFEIIPFTNEQGQKFPDDTKEAFQFSVGDEYKILDIYMPDSYITNAENELLAKATEQFNLLKQPKVSYDLKTDPEFIKSLQTPIQIGDMVNVKDAALGVDKVLRVQKISKNLITDEVESIEIADAYEINFASKLILDVKEIKNVVNITKLGEINYSKLGLKTTEELKNLVFDTDGYFDSGNIKPFSIETNMLSVGSRSQQLSLSSVFRINQDGNANKVDVRAGVLFSQTLDKTWNVSALVSTIPDNDYRYVYAKASKTTSTASIYLSKNQIPFDSDVNDYYFLVGVLHSVVDGVRILSLTVGTTTISGGLIRTGIISSLDGLTSFNLNTGEIKGKITFSSGSSGYENLTDKPDLSSFEETRDYVNSTLQTDLTDLKNRADGVIESWFYSHTPTLSNLPASNWGTTEERNAHIGDTFTNMQEFVDNVTTPDAGKAWRFVKNETTGEFSWSLIANSDSTKALIEAGKAKDTADAKRRVFVSQPYPPYNIGDLWVQGNGGDIMRCKSERLSGSYVATDFEKASKYTDDTAVNNLQIGGRNLLKNSAVVKSNANYELANYSLTGDHTFVNGEDYTITIWGNLGADRNNFVAYNSGDAVYLGTLQKITDGVYRVSFKWKNTYAQYTANNTSIYIYQPHFLKTSVSTINKIKLEKGNKGSDWTPAPEDIDAKISAEAQKVIDLENKTDFLTGTTIEGNAVATGTLLVGNSEGTNAGITGLGNTSDGVYLWGGGTYQEMVQGLAKKEQRRNGIDIWRHPNGQIGFEIGIKDGRLIFNGYHSSGFKLFELDPNRGLVNVAYTQESWTETPFRKLTYSSSTFNESTIASEIQEFISKRSRKENLNSLDFLWTTTYTVTQNAVGYDYDNGTNPANASYESLKGMKANNNDRYTNIANGWYMTSIGEVFSESSETRLTTYTFTVYVYYYQDGKVTQTKAITITK